MTDSNEKYLAIPAGRQKQILDYIGSHGSAQIKELADYCGVSEATVRRDLDDLDAGGRIERTHGGAMCVESSTSFERIHQEKMKLMLEYKRRIAKLAASMVKEGDTIILDSGTTTFFVAQNLAGIKDLSVITYDLFIANEVKLHSTSSLIVTGGIRREGYNVLVGSEVENYIRNVRVNKVFLGADAIDLEFGVSNANLMEASIKRLLLSAGKKRILVSDHSKLGHTAMVKVCGLEEIDAVVMDSQIPRDMLEQFQKFDIELLLA